MGSEGTLDTETLEPRAQPVLKAPERVAALTIAWHPDPARIGDRAVLSELAGGRSVVVSRAEPSFVDAEGRSRGPLHDPHVSRAPVRLTARSGAVEIDVSETRAAVEIDGRSVSGRWTVDPASLERGVLLRISGDIVFVLRNIAPSATVSARRGLVGISDGVEAVRRAIEIAGRHDDPVLIEGASGTGKELVASAIHAASGRAAQPFVAINMAALTVSTAAAELFGHARGAFTGAESAHAGYFGRADGGTLFLDEVGEAPDAIQPMLLRALETHDIEPLGGRGAKRVDVRIVAATDRDLATDVEAGRFRRPLLHRLATQRITVPPLCERREDIMPLFVHFLRREIGELDPSALPVALASDLLARPWSGNVRELRNVALTLAREGLRAALASPMPRDDAQAPVRSSERATDAQIAETLKRNGFRIGATSRELGIARNTLYKRMEQCEGLRRARDLSTAEIEASRTTAGGDVDRMASALGVSARALRLRLRELGIAT